MGSIAGQPRVHRQKIRVWSGRKLLADWLADLPRDLGDMIVIEMPDAPITARVEVYPDEIRLHVLDSDFPRLLARARDLSYRFIRPIEPDAEMKEAG